MTDGKTIKFPVPHSWRKVVEFHEAMRESVGRDRGLWNKAWDIAINHSIKSWCDLNPDPRFENMTAEEIYQVLLKEKQGL